MQLATNETDLNLLGHLMFSATTTGTYVVFLFSSLIPRMKYIILKNKNKLRNLC